MVDIFNVDQGKRMFAFIGIGGTLGALAGGSATNLISSLTESVYLPPALMLIGASFFGVAILVMLRLDRLALSSEHSQLTLSSSGPAESHSSQKPGLIGGTYWDGITAIVRSPYLLGIATYIVLMAIANTFVYFTQASIILENTDTFSQRVGSFAFFDMLTQFVTLLTQIFITTRIIKRLGIGLTLTIMPLITLAGFAILAIWPLYGIMAIFAALHRAARYAISRPARETLFSVVPPAEKYKAKPLIDVFLYRGGDVAGASIEGALRAAGMGISGVAGAVVPLAAIWAVLCIALGRAQNQRDPVIPVAETAETEPRSTIRQNTGD